MSQRNNTEKEPDTRTQQRLNTVSGCRRALARLINEYLSTDVEDSTVKFRAAVYGFNTLLSSMKLEKEILDLAVLKERIDVLENQRKSIGGY